MAGDGVAVDAAVAAAVARWVSGDRLPVAATCRDLGVSRSTFYKYAARFAERGVDGFFPDSRRPHRSPTTVGVQVEEAIVRARKELLELGLDAGASSVLGWLADRSGTGPAGGWPSRATVHRVLLRRGMVRPQPAKRPLRSAVRRFAERTANGMWQMDGFVVDLADGTPVVVIQILDDCTRLDLACHVAASENAQDAWTAFTTAAERYGLPARLLTDNGTAFSGARRGWTSALEAAVRALGVQPICSRPGHPQTCGKVERAHQTARRWLARRPPASTPGELQAVLEDYRAVYNHRRHQALGGLTPAQRWAITARSGPAAGGCPEPLHVTTSTVSPAGCVAIDGTEVSIGRRHARAQATTFRTGDDVAIFIGTALTRQLRLDRTRRYQPQQAVPSAKS